MCCVDTNAAVRIVESLARPRLGEITDLIVERAFVANDGVLSIDETSGTELWKKFHEIVAAEAICPQRTPFGLTYFEGVGRHTQAIQLLAGEAGMDLFRCIVEVATRIAQARLEPLLRSDVAGRA